MKPLSFFSVLFLIIFINCKEAKDVDFKQQSIDIPHIEGKPEYLNSPYVTAGNRIYMVGHHDGSFPELGWHIKGEMGGIWDHPIKLMDGFEAELILNDQTIKLEKSNTLS